MPSHKPVLLARGGGASLLQEGMVADISRDGLGIVTTPSLPVGSSIEIEFTQGATDASATPMFVRGRVVHVKALPDATFALGVETLVTPNVKTSTPHAFPDPLPVPAAAMEPTRKTPSARSTESKDRRRWIPIVLVLLVPFSIGWTTSELPNKHSPDNREAEINVVDALAVQAAPALPKRSGEREKRARNTPLSPVQPSDDQPDKGMLKAGRTARLQPHATGDPSLVRVPVMPIPEREPSEYTKTAQGNAMTPRPLLQEQAASNDLDEEAKRESRVPASWVPQEGVAVIIDKSAFSLTLYRNGNPVRTVPVAVGEDDSTPTGAFTVVNKLTDPIWHNRGEGVPPGDPRNPLGKRWLGLARDGRPTTYGIHAATDTSKVGQPFGDGCLRLHPEDLETVFRICHVGTKVLIQP